MCPRAELIDGDRAGEGGSRSGLGAVGAGGARADYPELIGGCRFEPGIFWCTPAVHLAYHLGQVDSHRRVVTGNAEGVGAVVAGELGSARKVGRRS